MKPNKPQGTHIMKLKQFQNSNKFTARDFIGWGIWYLKENN